MDEKCKNAINKRKIYSKPENRKLFPYKTNSVKAETSK